MALSINSKPCRKKVAIVGSGSAGIAALWALNRTHHDVYLYEGAGRLGGHTNTVEWRHGKFKTLVDTGFIVINEGAYPNFLAFLKKLGVRTAPTEMTIGVSRGHGSFEWAGTGTKAIFAQRRNLLSPRMWRVGFDLVRFNQFALDVLIADEIGQHFADMDDSAEETMGEYLQREGYSDAFRDDYLIPVTAAVWGISPDKSFLELPAVTLIRFLWNHHLLSTPGSAPQWLTILDGSKAYIDVVMKGFPSNHLFLNAPVKAVTNNDDGKVRIELENGKSEVYDHVILATPGDEAYSIIQPSATDQEHKIMSQFRTSPTTAVLHSDTSLMPPSRETWSSCNYLTPSPRNTGRGTDHQASLTYNINTLQRIPRHPFGDILLTLNPFHDPDCETVQGSYTYSQPVYNAAAQQQLPLIQNTRGISYAGAWTGGGSHEDGFSSGLRVAHEHLGAKLPFPLKDSSYSRGRKPELGLRDYTLRLIILIIQVCLVEFVGRALLGFKGRGRRREVARVNGSLSPEKIRKVF